MNEKNSLLTIKEASKILKINPEVLRRWLRAKHFPGVKVGGDWRIYNDDIKDFLKGKSANLSDSEILSEEGPKMCVKFPKWVEYSGLPAQLNSEIGPEAWPIFKKLIELDFEDKKENERRIFLSRSALPERTGYTQEIIEKIILVLQKKLYVKIANDPKEGKYLLINTPLRTPRLVIDIEFENGGAKGAPSKALQKACLRRYLEFS
ncbi:MAG: helix-turn-helix domain-containing protein [Candidatus Riflebacteria bacterium]|nr:helix-turn-helix domain-containing protein [Candidatus Riflebacteria bacterium]